MLATPTLRRCLAERGVERLFAEQSAPVELRAYPNEVHHAHPVLRAIRAEREEAVGLNVMESNPGNRVIGRLRHGLLLEAEFAEQFSQRRKRAVTETWMASLLAPPKAASCKAASCQEPLAPSSAR